jgi:hypothetical protein
MQQKPLPPVASASVNKKSDEEEQDSDEDSLGLQKDHIDDYTVGPSLLTLWHQWGKPLIISSVCVCAGGGAGRQLR